ncbi:ABC transporter ATP-binding protein [Arthrobacter russicus]|jgi:branched-chain amino acid transport system ATP-binding protein|uniref:Branched-chain amino acid transport system ATP-binding protein n=1 Tax=Arthrobacter russicus TaxID=172040 RepID=A0ABU1JAJ4_9MICC|nr:ABC transporter ATP-binding protein [Arthrobacter russicus]MBQ1444178.1 ABC transporter ATP-binding protein [Renibacterium sp.]MDN5669199.1 ABC transporter ATP-binding protein [Renibacterium salmoninarum]MDR6269155.1 branched-chain amino acid transport system ATP-binding protein [Arthrobacter russicus]
MTLLELNDVSVFYGRIQAIHNMSFSVEQGEIVSLIGANGAGKTTTMKTISGLLNPSSGSITFEGADITKMKAHIRVVQGISQAPEGRGIFPGMTVAENLDMGAFGRADKTGMDADLDRVFDLFPRLKERQKQLGGTMSGGEQQMLAIGRALMSNPKLLLLDEPSMGLAPQFIRQIFSIISEINKQGTTVLLVEQNANQALARADRAFVLETGAITQRGTGKELLANPAIKEAYLGVA